MVLSRLSAKGQVTLPKQVRKAIHISPGEMVGYEISKDGNVSIHKVEAMDIAYHKSLGSTLGEWNSKSDDRAYRDL